MSAMRFVGFDYVLQGDVFAFNIDARVFTTSSFLACQLECSVIFMALRRSHTSYGIEQKTLRCT
jgi:hypothetical protein